jgi:hypothetical protein
MEKVADGEWALAIYQPECIEFLYQYVLVKVCRDAAVARARAWCAAHGASRA